MGTFWNGIRRLSGSLSGVNRRFSDDPTRSYLKANGTVDHIAIFSNCDEMSVRRMEIGSIMPRDATDEKYVNYILISTRYGIINISFFTGRHNFCFKIK